MASWGEEVNISASPSLHAVELFLPKRQSSCYVGTGPEIDQSALNFSKSRSTLPITPLQCCWRTTVALLLQQQAWQMRSIDLLPCELPDNLPAECVRSCVRVSCWHLIFLSTLGASSTQQHASSARKLCSHMRLCSGWESAKRWKDTNEVGGRSQPEPQRVCPRACVWALWLAVLGINDVKGGCGYW